jgi:hypothetical protein
MDRRKLIKFISLLIPGFIGVRLTALGVDHKPKNESEKSPHAEAISLVIEKQGAEITKAELNYFKEKGTDWFKGDIEQYWWLDTIGRTWSALRPLRSGVVDATHFFTVEYSIGDTVIARWRVDTRKGTATLLAKNAVM